jgi:O-antigen/teichoic acid export membrane protein
VIDINRERAISFVAEKPLTGDPVEGVMAQSETASSATSSSGWRSFLENYGTTIFGQGLVLGFGVLTGILSARILGPTGRGEYVAVCIWPTGIATLFALGVNQAVAFNVGRRAFTISEMATAATVIGFIQSALTVFIGFLVIPHVLAGYSPTVQHLGIVFLVLTPALILGVYTGSLFQGAQDLLRFNFIRVLPSGVYLAGLLGIYLTHHQSLRAVILSQLLGYVVALIFGLTLVWRIFAPRWRWNKAAIPSLVSFGYRTQATSLANYFNQRIDQIILSLFVPPHQLGFYAVAVTLSTTVTVFPLAAGIVTFSRGSRQSSEDAKATIGHSFRASLIWLLASCIALYALTPFLIHLVFGPAFDGSIQACRILLPGALMTGLNQVLYNGASALGRPGLPSCAEGVSMAFTAVGLFILVPRYGYVGAAIVSSVAYTISFLVMLILAQMLLGLRVSSLLRSRPLPGNAPPNL